MHQQGLTKELPVYTYKNLIGRIREFPYGITATKKIGIAVDRNKAKRRLRHAVKEVLPKLGKNGYDYVVVATKNTNTLPWEVIKSDLEKAFKE